MNKSFSIKKICFFGALSFFFVSNVQAKVLIITTHFNRPDFVEWQYKTFKKFLKDDYELVVFNDAKEARLEAGIAKMCNKYGIRCFRVSPEIHSRPYLHRGCKAEYDYPSVRNVNVIQYALDTIGFDHKGLVAILDGDMFPIRPISFERYMKGVDFAGVTHTIIAGQQGIYRCKDLSKIPQEIINGKTVIKYMWVGIALMNMNTLPERKTINFNCGFVEGINTDSGGYTYYYLKNHPEIKTKHIELLTNESSNGDVCQLICNSCKLTGQYKCEHNTSDLYKLGFNSNEKDFIQAGPCCIDFVFDNAILHYRASTNYDNRSPEYHDAKTRFFSDFMNKILADV